MGFAPAACVVVTVSVPQVEPLQPAPESAKEKSLFGCQPGTGVILATRMLNTSPDASSNSVPTVLKWNDTLAVTPKGASPSTH
jgi:hypothetical protein